MLFLYYYYYYKVQDGQTQEGYQRISLFHTQLRSNKTHNNLGDKLLHTLLNKYMQRAGEAHKNARMYVCMYCIVYIPLMYTRR